MIPPQWWSTVLTTVFLFFSHAHWLIWCSTWYHCFQWGIFFQNNINLRYSDIGVSIINHPFWGTPNFGNTQIAVKFSGTVNTISPFHFFRIRDFQTHAFSWNAGRKLQAKKPISASVDEIKKVRLKRFDWKKGDFILRPKVLRGLLNWNGTQKEQRNEWSW